MLLHSETCTCFSQSIVGIVMNCRRRMRRASSVQRSWPVNTCGNVPLNSSTSTRMYCTLLVMTRAHIFPWKILPISADQFAKFRRLLWQSRPNSAAHLGLPFLSKLSSVLLKNSFRRASWHSDIVLSYASNVQRK